MYKLFSVVCSSHSCVQSPVHNWECFFCSLRSVIVLSKGSFIQHLLNMYCVLNAALGAGKTSRNTAEKCLSPDGADILMGDVSGFYFDGHYTPQF